MVDIKKCYRAISFIPESNKTDLFYKNILKHHNNSLKYIPKEIKNINICKIAVTELGCSLFDIPKNVRNKMVI